MTQTPAKTIHAPNLARSAMAPEMRATVMIANVAWKPAKAIVGYAAWMFEDCASSKAWPRPIWFQSMLKNPTHTGDRRAVTVVGEGDRVAVEHPQDADEGDRAEATSSSC